MQIHVIAKCSDCCAVSIPDLGLESHGEVPRDLGIGGGDYIKLVIDSVTGKIDGWLPLSEEDLRECFPNQAGTVDKVSDKVSDKSIAVWWVNQADYKAIDEEQVPKGYIREQFRSRRGRAGRGRLWVPSHIECDEVEVPKSVCYDGPDTHGGIVILKEDIEDVRSLGGILSDADGNIL